VQGALVELAEQQVDVVEVVAIVVEKEGTMQAGHRLQQLHLLSFFLVLEAVEF
jgi:hypothetical protein